MKLSPEAHRKVEEFFRRHHRRPDLILPPVSVYAGGFARLLMKAVGMSAITLGRRVFVAPHLVRRGSDGRRALPGWLLVHEAAHVLQYEEKGYLRFFRDYLGGYWGALRDGKRWDKEGRMAAYLAIKEECAARESERCYLELGERVKRSS